MKICVVGHFTEHPDEGVRNLTYYLARELIKKHKIVTINISNPFSWVRIMAFRPDIIHFVLCPTIAGLVIAKLLSFLCPSARTIISALQPACLPRTKWMSLFKPDLVLVQSTMSEKMFQELGYKTRFLPNGVDIDRFVPVTVETRVKLRQKYGVPKDKFIILHIASLKSGRNLEVFRKLQSEHCNQVLVLGRVGEHRDEELHHELESAGCLVRTDYLLNIEEIYALSDCYIFPTIDGRYCIETPLSVLEAMSCNLPVVTTPFGALPRMFEEGDGLIFVEEEKDFFDGVETIKSVDKTIKTRERILPFSWERVVEKLEGIYEQSSG